MGITGIVGFGFIGGGWYTGTWQGRGWAIISGSFSFLSYLRRASSSYSVV